MNRSVKRNPKILWEEVEGEIILLNPKKGDYFGLKKVSASFWELINDQTDIDTIIQGLLSQYDVDEDTLKKDIFLLIEKLESRNLISVI